MPKWIDPAAVAASKFVNSTSCHVFLTGRAGTGKTTFLHDISQRTHKSAVVAAPTGIAAINAGGVTLHSLFQLPFGAFVPEEQFSGEAAPDFEINTPQSIRRNLKMHTTKRNMLKKLEMLIIDEVSMLRADLLDAIDVVLRHIRRRPDQTFGGVQILFIGDLLQLPPVVKDAEWQLMRRYYPTMFFFGARALQAQQPVYIELTHIYRQTDKEFISVLNHLRDDQLTQSEIDLLNRHHKPGFKANSDDGYVYLTTHNRKADRINAEQLEKLPGKTYHYTAETHGTFDEHVFPVDPVLTLKKDAQVMFIKNDPTGEQRFFNGKIGKIESLKADGIKVGFADETPAVWVEPYSWENKRYTLNKETNEIEEKVVGTFSHFPLKLAWAITIHKSQGLTFNKAVIDVAEAFAAGQVYVALSRLTSLDGLILTSPFSRQDLPREPALEAFTRQKMNVQNLRELFKSESFEYLKNTVKKAFNFDVLWMELNYHIRSYNKDTIHSKKQKHEIWARSLQTDFKPVKDVGDKFLKQLDTILQSAPDGNLDRLQERVEAAKQYFEPIFSGFSKRVRELAAELKKQPKGVKQYIRELEQVELLFYGQLQQVYKAAALIQAARREEELTKASIKAPLRPETSTPEAGPAKKKSPKKKTSDTKTISLRLFNQGKTVDDIAAERALTTMTIEGHIAHWVQKGEIDISRLVSKEVLDEITAAFETLDTDFLKPVYEYLSEKYDYATIKFVAAFMKRGQQ